tara:strand:+ start:13912 stop:14475 length:564 start_codon:yes stop_codon:yes gene_type:complete
MLSIFIPWDIWFTENGIWGFNEYYISGIYLLNLPLEECLFFICIPFCCIFTYHVVWTLSNDKSFDPMKNISFILSIILFGCGIFWMDKLYTFYTFIGLSIMLLIAPFTVNMKIFFKAFVILLVPFFIVNGLLTGSFIENQVVWYNDNHNLGIRLFTIPVEDIFYNCFMLLLVMIGYQKTLSFKKITF